MRNAGIGLLCIVIGAAILAAWLAPYVPDRRVPVVIYGPPTADLEHEGAELEAGPLAPEGPQRA